jgi:hypothetical protein
MAIALAILPGVSSARNDNDNFESSADNDNGEGSQPKDKPPSANRESIVPAGARPDLKIEYWGFQNPANTQLITFKVTNVGTARSSAIKAKVVTLEPEPTPWQRDLDVMSLAPGASVEIYYPLSASCNGHRVVATVNDPLDFPSVNDRAEVDVCPNPPPLQAEVPPVIVVVVDGILTPVQQRVGEHKDGGRYPAFEVGPSVSQRQWIVRKNYGALGCLGDHSPEDIGDTNVGFDYADWTGCEFNQVQQLIVDFDLQWLRALEKKLVLRAELLYDETNVLGQTFTVGRTPSGQITCIGRLGEAPADWPQVVASKSLISSSDTSGERLAGGWDVTYEVQRSLAPSSDWHGLVLHGRDEDLDAEDGFKRCRSQVTNIRLKLQYSVL